MVLHLLVVALAALILKDTLYLGLVSEALRLGSLAAAGIAGLIVVVSRFQSIRWGACWPLGAYLALALVPVAASFDPPYVLFQAASIGAACVAGLGLATSRSGGAALLRAAAVFIALAVLASLVAIVAAPERAYEVLPGGETRFRGVFPEPANLGLSAGLLVGIGWLSIKQVPLRVVVCGLGLAALLFALSRTAMLAAAAAAALTFSVYGRRRPLLILGTVWAGLALAFGTLLLETRSGGQLVSTVVRPETLTTLTGRTVLWADGLRVAADRPWFGYGLTMGSLVLTGERPREAPGLQLAAPLTTRETTAATVHSGYLQSLMDSGALGFALYLTVIVGSIAALWRKDRGREQGAMMYALVFMAVANLAENAIQTASVAYSALFWVLAALALGMNATQRPAVPAEQARRARPGNLLG